MLFGCDLNMLSAIKCIFSQRRRRGGVPWQWADSAWQFTAAAMWGERASECGPRLISICASRCWLVSRPLAGHLPAPPPSFSPTHFPSATAYTAYTSMRASLPALPSLPATLWSPVSVCLSVCPCLCCCCCCCHPACCCCSHCCCVFPLFDRD